MTDSVQKVVETQLKNIQERTGKSLTELYSFIKDSGLEKHGQIRSMLIEKLGMGYGDANTLAAVFLQPNTADSQPPAGEDMLDTYYAGSKVALRPIHEAVMTEINKLGEFEISPKKTYVSLRRKRQFAMLGPASKGRVELGLNMKGLDGTDRLLPQPAGDMCQYKVFLTSTDEVDDELLGWIKTAYASAG